MEEIAAVGVRIDTVGIERGAQELDRLASKGPVVEKSMAGIEQSSGRAGKTIATLGQSSGQGLSNLSRDADKAAASIGKTGDAARSASSELASFGKSLLGALSVREFAQAADAVTTLQNQLKLATGSATSAASAYASLFDIAQRSRVGFTDIGKTFASIARSSESLKLNQEQLLKVTEAVANAVTISGSSAASSQAALVQLGQGLSSGVLRGEELNSILEQTPRLARAIADGLSVPIGALRKLGEEGKLTSAAVATALRSQSATLAREVEDSVTTVGQAFVQTKNAATALAGEISRATGSNSLLVASIQAVADSLNDVSSAMKTFESNAGKFEFVGAAVGVVFETISVLGATAVDTIAGMGREFAAVAAQARAIASGDFSGVTEIRRALIEDNERAERELDSFISKVMTARGLRKQAIADLAALDTRAEDARLSRLAGNSVPALDFSKLISGAKKAADQFASLRSAAKEWADAFEDLAKIQADAEASTNGLTKGQARLLEVLKSRGFKEASDSAKELVLQQAYAAIAAEKLKEETEALGKIADESRKSYSDWIDEIKRGANDAINQADKLKLEAEASLLVVEGYRSLAQAIEIVTIKRLQEKQIAMMGDEAAVMAIQKEIDARRELIGLIGNKGSRDAAAKAAKDAAEAWRKTADKIEDAITDSLMRGFESGKGFAENLRDTVENMFKTMVLRPVISAIVQPVAQQLTGSLGLVNTAANAYGMVSGASSLSLMAANATGAVGPPRQNTCRPDRTMNLGAQ